MLARAGWVRILQRVHRFTNTREPNAKSYSRHTRARIELRNISEIFEIQGRGWPFLPSKHNQPEYFFSVLETESKVKYMLQCNSILKQIEITRQTVRGRCAKRGSYSIYFNQSMNLNPRWSYVIQRHGSCETTFLQKMKKDAQKVIKKRVPFVSNTRG